MVLSNSVSIQRVWIVNGLVGRRARTPGRDDHGAVERACTVGMPVDDELVQGAAGPLERLLAGRAGDDQLGEHRVERAADDVALDDAGVDADAGAGGGTRSAVTVPGAGRKLRPASSPLIRNSIEWRVRLGVVVAERLAVGDAELLAHEVDAGDLLGDGVLDLQAGVDLEEARWCRPGPTRNSQVPAPT